MFSIVAVMHWNSWGSFCVTKVQNTLKKQPWERGIVTAPAYFAARVRPPRGFVIPSVVPRLAVFGRRSRPKQLARAFRQQQLHTGVGGGPAELETGGRGQVSEAWWQSQIGRRR